MHLSQGAVELFFVLEITGRQGRNPYHGTPALMKRRRARMSRDWPDFGDTLKMRGLCGLPIPLERFSRADVTWKCRPRSECLTAQPGYCALPAAVLLIHRASLPCRN